MRSRKRKEGANQYVRQVIEWVCGASPETTPRQSLGLMDAGGIMKDEIAAIYAKLPTIDCKGLCASECKGILMTGEEWRRLRKAFGPLRMVKPNRCPVLDEQNRCSQYQYRPLICRLYGLVEGMKCPHGCKPSPRYLTDDEGQKLLAEMVRVGGKYRTDLVEMGLSAVKARL